jgi:hypothetical protein
MRAFISVLLAMVLVGCAVNGPINSSSVIDDSPLLTFVVHDFDPSKYELFVDGLEYGTLDKYLNNTAAVKLIPGQHTVVVTKNGNVVYEKSEYFGEGTTKVVTVGDQ